MGGHWAWYSVCRVPSIQEALVCGIKLCVVVHACNSSPPEVEAGRSQVRHSPPLLSKFEVSLRYMRPVSKRNIEEIYSHPRLVLLEKRLEVYR